MGYEIKSTKILKNESFGHPESQLCSGVMDIDTLLYLTVVARSNKLKLIF